MRRPFSRKRARATREASGERGAFPVRCSLPPPAKPVAWGGLGWGPSSPKGGAWPQNSHPFPLPVRCAHRGGGADCCFRFRCPICPDYRPPSPGRFSPHRRAPSADRAGGPGGAGVGDADGIGGGEVGEPFGEFECDLELAEIVTDDAEGNTPSDFVAHGQGADR